MPSIYSTKEKNWQLRLDYNVTPNSSKNQSEISCEIYIYNTGGNSNLTANGAYYRIQASGGYDSGRVYQPYDWPEAAWHYVGKYVFTVPHDSDGTKSVTLNGYWNAGHETAWTPRDLEAAATVTLPTIPRASTVSAGSFTIGEAGSVVIKAAVPSFRHKLTYEARNRAGYIPPSGEELPGGDVTWTPPRLLLQEATDSTVLMATLYCQTFAADGTHIGRSQVPVKLYVPTDVCPTLNHIELAPVNTNKWLDQQGIYVAGYSQVLLTADATAGEGTVLESMSVTGFGTGKVSTGNVKEYRLSWKSPTLTAGEKSFTITANDQRPGRSGSVKRTVTPYEYTPPAITQSEVFRCNAEGQAQSDGGYIRVRCSAAIAPLNGRNTLTLRMRIHPAGEAWGGYTVLTSGDVKIIPGFSAQKSYEVEITATDSLGEVKTIVYMIPTAEAALHLRPGGKGMAIGKYSEKEAFECAMPADFQGSVYGNAYGLGALPIVKAGSNLNSFVHPGIWGIPQNDDAATIANIPQKSAGTLRVWASNGAFNENSDGAYRGQEYTTSQGIRYYRYLNRSGQEASWVFGPWECVNPPMEVGVEYCTTEKYLGKSVYKRVFELGNVPSSDKNYSHGIANITHIVACGGEMYSDGGSSYSLPFANDRSYGVGCYASVAAITIYNNNGDYTRFKVRVTLSYTKN